MANQLSELPVHVGLIFYTAEVSCFPKIRVGFRLLRYNELDEQCRAAQQDEEALRAIKYPIVSRRDALTAPFLRHPDHQICFRAGLNHCGASTYLSRCGLQSASRIHIASVSFVTVSISMEGEEPLLLTLAGTCGENARRTEADAGLNAG